jgi:hypothetical protein
MKQPDEVPAINVQEHLKIVVSDRSVIGNSEAIVTKTIFSQRVK